MRDDTKAAPGRKIRVQSVEILCERCPVVKDPPLGCANGDVISPLPPDERIPDPVGIIAKNLSKERKQYLQRVKARGMPERFSVSLAKPRDWRRTVKVRAPKRRRKVDEKLHEERTGTTTTTTTTTTKNNSNGNEMETTTRGRRKEKEKKTTTLTTKKKTTRR